MAFKLSSNAFSEGGTIPRLHTCDGADVSPSLEWKDTPAGTSSFVLIMDDPDAPAGTWTHWVLYDLPSTLTTLPQGYKPGQAGRSGMNSFGKKGYGGPCPPRGHGPHRYFFKLYAVNEASLGLPEGARREDVEQAMREKAIAEARCMGRYERQ